MHLGQRKLSPRRCARESNSCVVALISPLVSFNLRSRVSSRARRAAIGVSPDPRLWAMVVSPDDDCVAFVNLSNSSKGDKLPERGLLSYITTIRDV